MYQKLPPLVIIKTCPEGHLFICVAIELSVEEGGLMYTLSIVDETVGLTDEITRRIINTVLVKGVL